MLEGAAYILSSFWLGAVHAATPGHGKTVAAAYLVGTRGRATDAVALGIFVTLAHTSGILIFGVLATIGSTALSQRSESYVSLASALLMVGIGGWMVLGYIRDSPYAHHGHHHHHHHDDHPRLSDEVPGPGAQRPSWSVLLGLALAGGLLPDPAALAVLLSAVASGKLVLGLLTVVVFSVGFASVLVVVGAVVGRAGRISLRWLADSTLQRLQLATALVIVLVGALMSVGAWRQLLA
jgi:nickel/cobalt exporter